MNTQKWKRNEPYFLKQICKRWHEFCAAELKVISSLSRAFACLCLLSIWWIETADFHTSVTSIWISIKSNSIIVKGFYVVPSVGLFSDHLLWSLFMYTMYTFWDILFCPLKPLGNLAWLKSGNLACIKQAQYIIHSACTF